MTNKERLAGAKFKKIKEYYSAMGGLDPDIQEDMRWLINRVEELEKQRNERTHLLNAEVARNQRYKKVLERIVNHAGKGIDIDYELWKMAKRALEESE